MCNLVVLFNYFVKYALLSLSKVKINLKITTASIQTKNETVQYMYGVSIFVVFALSGADYIFSCVFNCKTTSDSK